MGKLEKIADIEFEMNRTQKNKATEHHLGRLKGKIAKLRAEILLENSAKGPAGEGFDVVRAGHCRVALIGFPSVGKSTFLSHITNTASEAASYEFTTLTCIPGNLMYNDAVIQILDLPGIVEGAAQGKGRGREVISVARNSDMVLMMLDAVRADVQIMALTKELRDCGIRLNENLPLISFTKKKEGNIKFNATVPLTHLDERLVKGILQDYKIHHAEIVIREDATADQFIDIIVGNRKYMPCLYLMNKIDNASLEECDRLAHAEHSVVCSVKKDWNMDFLKERLWDYLNIKRVYTKRKGGAVDIKEPVILRERNGKRSTIKSVCEHIHRDMVGKFKFAKIWGKSSKFNPEPQRVGLSHVFADEDVVEIVART